MFPSPQMTAPTVNSGGLTITSGNIGVNAGVAAAVAVGIGVTTAMNAGISINGTLQAQGTFGMGIFSGLSVQAAANGDQLYGILLQPVFLPNSKTSISAYAARFTPGAVSGAVNNTGLQVDTPSGASGSNVGIIAAGGAPAILVQSGGLTVTAGNTSHGAGELTGNAGSAAMTTGFIWIPAANAAPTGTPTAGLSGRAPMYYDSNLKRFNIWDGTWRGITLT